ncbi:MAG: metallophosphoesterase [Ruminococcus sp.]|nr:metallophosphoesterase [Candidatus Copronaster equi]
MKKILSVFLAFILVFSAIPFSYAADSDSLHIAVTGDIHTMPAPEKISHTNDSLYSNAHDLGNLFDESMSIFSSFLKDVKKASPQYLLITGDLTEAGTKEQCENVKNYLQKFEKETNIPVYIVPGNHEALNKELSREEIKEIFADFGFNEALTCDTETCSYTVDLDKNYRLLAIDSVSWGECQDGITDSLMLWIKEQVKTANNDGKHIIAMMHHPLVEHFILHSTLLPEFIIKNWKELATFFADNGIQYVFTGHEHENDIAEFTSKNGNTVYDCMSPSLNYICPAYRDIVFSDENVSFNLRKITEIDDTQLSANYPEVQKQALKNDLWTYSYGYFSKSMELVVRDIIESEKIINKLPVSNKIISNIINRVLFTFEDCLLDMPLYGKGSLSELAAKQGIKIPETKYNTLFDCCVEILAAHYRGDENIPANDPIIQTAVKGVAFAAEYSLQSLSPVLQKTVLQYFGIKYRNSIYESVIKAISPIIEGATVDLTPDSNVVLPAYREPVTANFFQKIINTIKPLFESVIRVLKIYSI